MVYYDPVSHTIYFILIGLTPWLGLIVGWDEYQKDNKTIAAIIMGISMCYIALVLLVWAREKIGHQNVMLLYIIIVLEILNVSLISYIVFTSYTDTRDTLYMIILIYIKDVILLSTLTASPPKPQTTEPHKIMKLFKQT